MYIFMPVSKCISSARRRHHMSYNDVANGICPRQMLIEFEKGVSLPSKGTAIKLANRLGYVPETFVLALRDDVVIRSNARMLEEQNRRFFTIMQERDTFGMSDTPHAKGFVQNTMKETIKVTSKEKGITKNIAKNYQKC